MVFERTKPIRKYADYARYRPHLRVDFRHRCAYCLRHEGHNGGEANFCIDHRWPVRGEFGRLDLENIYENLYYACCECNENKADHWPTPDQLQQGYQFIDPCEPSGDHNLHWNFHPDGSLEAVTNAGQYTDIVLQLWRPQLKDWRQRMHRLQQIAYEIENVLFPQLTPEERADLQQALDEIKAQIDPPVFDRPRGRSRSVPI
jgi:hypothetical protein